MDLRSRMLVGFMFCGCAVAVGCGDSSGDGGDGSGGDGSGAAASGGADATGGGAACSPGTSCTAGHACISLEDNATAAKPGLRMAQLTFSAPTTLRNGLLASLLSSATLPSVASCNLDGTGTLSWLLQFDPAATTIKTGGAKPVADPSAGYAFVEETVNGVAVAPVLLDGAPDASGAFSVTVGADAVIPFYVGADDVVLMPIKNLRFIGGVLSEGASCIGRYDGANLDPLNSCLPDEQTPAFVSGASLDGHILLQDADNSIITTLNQSLCVWLSGDPAAYGDGGSPNKCKRTTEGEIDLKGDWCSLTDSAFDCRDALRLAGTFAASGVKIND